MGTINLWLIGILTHLKDVTPEETARLFQDTKELSIMQKMQETFVKEMDKRLK
jgi:hypothetical protein